MIEQEITLLTNGRISFQKCGNGLQFGYSKNRGVYSIKVKTSGEWNGLTIRAFWHIPDIKEPITSLLVDNVIRVPALVTSYKGEGRIVFEGSDGAKTVTSADVRYYVNKNSGTCDGTIPEPGTPAWQELVGTVKKYSDTAVEAKESAKKSADEAKQALEDTKDVKSQAIEEINSSKTAVIEEIENKKNLSIEEINSVKEDAKGELETLCDSTRDFANQAKEAADRAKESETKAQEYSNLSQSNANASSESASNAKASEDASKKNADDSAATLQELKDGIASGNFKGEKGDKGDPGAPGKDATVDTTLTHEGEAADAKATGDAISAVKARQNILTGTETGNPIAVDDAFSAPLCGLTVYGRSTQDGTPTPDAPVPIVSAGDGGSVAVTLSDGNGETQTLTLPTPNGLPGIPVTSGGNYTDPQGQQWVCDEVDLERGVKVQRVKVLNLLNSSGFDNNGTWHIATNQLGAGTSYTPLEWFTPAIKCLCNTLPVQMSKYQTGTDANLSIYYSQTGDVITLKSALFNPKGQRATVDEAKAWFTAHPTYLYVPIEPIETPLTPAEIAAYKALTAYGPDTVVQAGGGAGVKLGYQRDVNIAIKRIEDAVASMTTT